MQKFFILAYGNLNAINCWYSLALKKNHLQQLASHFLQDQYNCPWAVNWFVPNLNKLWTWSWKASFYCSLLAVLLRCRPRQPHQVIFRLPVERHVSPLNHNAEANEAKEARLGRHVGTATDHRTAAACWGGEQPSVDGRLAGSVCPLSAADRLSSHAPSHAPAHLPPPPPPPPPRAWRGQPYSYLSTICL